MPVLCSDCATSILVSLDDHQKADTRDWHCTLCGNGANVPGRTQTSKEYEELAVFLDELLDDNALVAIGTSSGESPKDKNPPQRPEGQIFFEAYENEADIQKITEILEALSQTGAVRYNRKRLPDGDVEFHSFTVIFN